MTGHNIVVTKQPCEPVALPLLSQGQPVTTSYTNSDGRFQSNCHVMQDLSDAPIPQETDTRDEINRACELQIQILASSCPV